MKKIFPLVAVGIFYLLLFIAWYVFEHPGPQALAGPVARPSAIMLIFYISLGIPFLGVAVTAPLFWFIWKVKPQEMEAQKTLIPLFFVFPCVSLIAICYPFDGKWLRLSLGLWGMGSVYWGVFCAVAYGLYLRHRQQFDTFRKFAMAATAILLAGCIGLLLLLFAPQIAPARFY